MIPPTISVYIAASWARRDLVRQLAEIIERQGFRVTSRWLSPMADAWTREQAAANDLADIDAADGLLSLTEGPEAGYQTGGRHVEFGWAACRGKWLWVVGPFEHVFHEGLTKVRRFDTVAQWLAFMLGRAVREVLPTSASGGNVRAHAEAQEGGAGTDDRR